MKAIERKVALIVLGTILLTIILGWTIHVKAVAREGYFSTDTDAFETAYRMELKDTLKEYGCKNAGITLTKTCEDGHHLDYSVVINLPGYINESEEANLLKSLRLVSLDVEDSDVSISFSRKEE